MNRLSVFSIALLSGISMIGAANAAVVGAPQQPSCLSSAFSVSDKTNAWYTAAAITVKNNCNSPIDLANAAISFQANSNQISPVWTWPFTSSAINYQNGAANFTLVWQGDQYSPSTLAVGASKALNFGMNLSGTAFNLTAAQSSLQVIPTGTPPAPSNGEIDVKINPTGVTGVTGSEAITLSSGTFSKQVSNSVWNQPSTYPVKSLAYGTYSVSAAAIGNYTAAVSPSSVTVNGTTPQVVTVTYTAKPMVGTVSVTIPAAPLSGIAANTVVTLNDNTSHQNYTQTVSWNKSAVFKDLPAGDNVGVSVPTVTNGLNKATPVAVAAFAVVGNTTTSRTISYQVTPQSTVIVPFTVSGLTSGKATVDLTDTYGNHYNYANLSNGAVNQSLPINDSFNVSATAPGLNATIIPVAFNTTASGTQTAVSVAFSAIVPSATYYSPYVDLGTFVSSWWPSVLPWDLTKISTASGVKSYHLAFITQAPAGNIMDPATGANNVPTHTCMPNIAGLALPYAQSLTTALKAQGDTYVISFGGAAGVDVGISCHSVEQTVSTQSQLFKLYQNVINTYQPNGLDFDIEGAFGGNTAENRAIWAYMFGNLKLIQDQNPNVAISLTLPVMPYGLTADGQAVVNTAKAAGLTNFQVNLMAMDYYQPAPAGENMGQNAIDAATGTFNFLKTIYPQASDSSLWARIAVTVLTGLNDTGEQFSLSDAAAVQAFAFKNGLAFTSAWSMNRDYPCGYHADGLTHDNAQTSCTGPAGYQTQAFQFSHALMGS